MCKLGDTLLKSSSLVSYAHSILWMTGQILPHPRRHLISSLSNIWKYSSYSPKTSASSWKGTCHTVVLCPISVADYPAHLETLADKANGPLTSSSLGDVHCQTLEPGGRSGKEIFCSTHFSTSGFSNIYRHYLHKKVREIKIHNKKGRQCCIVERACTVESDTHICAQTS